LGDVNRDGVPDLAVAAGFLGGPRVSLYTGTSLLGTGSPVRMVGDFFAFPGTDSLTLRNGVYVSIGDINGDGFGDMIFGAGPGGAPRVFILSGAIVANNNVIGAQQVPLSNFFVNGDENDRGGVRVGTANGDGDLKAELVIGSGQNTQARIQIYRGNSFTSTAEPIGAQVLDLFNSVVLADGIYVG
jgi:hypothetical protein